MVTSAQRVANVCQNNFFLKFLTRSESDYSFTGNCSPLLLLLLFLCQLWENFAQGAKK
jgi:hypothetical protein